MSKPMNGMTSQWNRYMKNRWQKIRTTASRVIDASSNVTENVPPQIEMDPERFHLLQELADRQRTTVTDLLNRAIRQYIRQNDENSRVRVTQEQKENNPLLGLDALVGNRKHTENPEDNGGIIQ